MVIMVWEMASDGPRKMSICIKRGIWRDVITGVIFNKNQILGTLEEYILETNIFVLLKE